MVKPNPMRDSVRYAIGLTTGALMLSGGYVQAQETDETAQPVEEVLVTGSRIKRSTNTQSQEIITINAEDMEIQGDISVADALRSSTLNSLGSFRESSGSSAQSNATINLRGAGSSRTLVLINGRRVAGSPSLGGGGTVNLNLIPFSAVDRVEIIPDGASAVYGSDAVAGVVNVVLKKGYDGLRVSGRYGDRDRDEGTEESISFLAGASNDRGSVTFGLEYDRKEPIFDKDRDFTKASYGDYDGDGDVVGYAETIGVSFYGYSAINPNWTPATVYDPNDQNTWYVTPGANCVDGVNGYAGVMRADLVFGPESGYYCGYAFALVSANRAGLERINSWVSAEYKLTDTIDAYIDVIMSDNESFGRYAPPAAPGPTIPGDPRNDIGATFGYFRWTDIGPRDNYVNDTFKDINIGLSGELASNLSWDLNYTYSDYRSSSVGMYYLSYAGLEYNISYNIQDFDQFVANLKATTHNDDRQNMKKWFAGLQWDMFEMAGGTASSYFGAEYYEVDYQALVDAQSEAGLIGGSAGNSAEGSRDVTAFSVEAIFPVTDWLEIDAAVRHDDYSDFGTATSPRIGFTMTWPGYDRVTIKGSWGQGFRAPDLSDLYGATSFSAESARDNYGCQLAGQSPCPSKQFDTYIGSNPNLDAETSETMSIGVTWEFLDGWYASVNHFTLTLEDAIEYTSAQDQLDVDFQTNGNNPNVERNAIGGVTRIDAGFQNAVTEVEREALDYAVNGMLSTDYGQFNMGWNATQYLNYDAERSYGTGDLYNAAGTLGFPEWRMNAFVAWSMNDMFANLAWDYIGESDSNVSDTKYKAWDVLNASVGYNFDSWGTVTFGANNVTDEDPLLDSQGAQVDEYQYPLVGRVWYLRYSIEM
jgi:iron complex outermembrane receptor protein